MIRTGPSHLRDLPWRSVPAGKASTVGGLADPLPASALPVRERHPTGRCAGTEGGPLRTARKSTGSTCKHKQGNLEKSSNVQEDRGLQGVLGLQNQMAGVRITALRQHMGALQFPEQYHCSEKVKAEYAVYRPPAPPQPSCLNTLSAPDD